MQSKKMLIEGRFASVRGDLDEILGRITQDMMGWAPAEGMRTIGGQLAEIASVEVPLVTFLREGRVMGMEEADAVIGDPDDFENLKRALVEARKVTLEHLGSLSDAELVEEVNCKEAWFGTFWAESLPRSELFVNVAAHEFYHVGQLVSYLWARGDNPYKRS